MRDVPGFERAASSAADTLKSAKNVTVVAHIDADGITAGSIASAALKRADIDHNVRFLKKLDDEEINGINEDPSEIVWLVDLGSGTFSMFDPSKVVVSDHHRVDSLCSDKIDLFSFGADHVNPHLFGIDGSTEISGAGATYAVAKNMGHDNDDLAALAVVGAAGDVQDNANGRLIGYNRIILQDAINAGRVEAVMDLRIFGRQTRPLHAFIMYSNDPPLMPVLKSVYQSAFRRADEIEDNDRQLIYSFLNELGIETRDEKGLRTWASLNAEEKKIVVSALSNGLLDIGKGVQSINRMIGEVYVLDPKLVDAPAGWLDKREATVEDTNEWRPSARVLLDAKEMATLLNACGRHGRPEIGMAICLGDREDQLSEALHMQLGHRNALREALSLVQEGGDFEIQELPSLRYFNGGEHIGDTIVGIVTGMLLGDSVPADRPLFGLVLASDGTATIKASARGARALVKRGLDLSLVMRDAANAVGGSGGGHNAAAGASIPEGKEEEFLQLASDIIGEQLNH
ncbi:MAG: DHH family phosphoesterase [Euryarchaeota archaeon]|nr:DHH family phosphoesterase [Euryarchaeota archaeon]